MGKITKNSGRQFLLTNFDYGGRRAGAGVLYDDYSETSGCKDYEKHDMVRFPNDKVKPEDLNGSVVIIKKAVVSNG